VTCSTGMRDAGDNEQERDERDGPESGEKLKPEMKSAPPGHAPTHRLPVAATRGGVRRHNSHNHAVACRGGRAFGAGLSSLLKKMGEWRWGSSAGQGGERPTGTWLSPGNLNVEMEIRFGDKSPQTETAKKEKRKKKSHGQATSGFSNRARSSGCVCLRALPVPAPSARGDSRPMNYR
jgi:hypothetical protein